MTTEIKSQPKGRIVSIDALRGFDMFWIMSGEVFFMSLFKWINTEPFLSLAHQFDHSAWHGFTAYDLIFPLFIFIMGVSQPFSISRRLEKGEPKKDLYWHIVKRTLVLYFFGLLYNGLLNFDFTNLRYTGVLHRIALCYFFASIIMMNVRNIKMQAFITGSILIVYWLILLIIPVPGIGSYILTPEGNLAGFIDRNWLYGSFCCYPYGDNEGILSMFPAISTGMLGVLTGHWLRTKETNEKKAKFLFFGGVAGIVIGLLWGLVFPINKYLWTSSYVCYAAGWSLLLLALFFWIIDLKGYKKWAFPFIVIGMNPITIYLVQGLFDFGIIVNIFVHGFVNGLGGFKEVFLNFSVITVKWLFLYFLYKKDIFLKV